MSSKLTLRLYRLFLRQASQLESQGLTLQMQMPMDTQAWLSNGGGHGWATAPPKYTHDSLARLLPWLATSPHLSSGTFTGPQLRQCVRQAFREPAPAATPAELQDRAFTSLKVLGEQVHMVECSSSATTRDVRVDVCSAFVGTQADLDPTWTADVDEPSKFYYTYRVRISNVGEKTVQLKSRHWVVKDKEGGVITEVARGARGVVGCTPILKPHTCFQYFSGTDLETPGGSMQGSFEMATLDAKGGVVDSFEAEIAPFVFRGPETME